LVTARSRHSLWLRGSHSGECAHGGGLRVGAVFRGLRIE
jgi:phosphoribosyl-AMP cyclohydrolase